MTSIHMKASRMAGFARLLVLAVLFSLSNAMMAQTTYTSAIMRYMTANGQMDQFDEMAKAATQVIALLRDEVKTIPASMTNEQLAKRYSEEQFPTDIAAIMSVKLREQVSIKDINELSELLESPEGKLAVTHSNEMAKEENMTDMLAQIQSDITDIMQGKKPKPMKVTASEERKKLFHGYYQGTMAKIMEPMINLYFPEDNGTQEYKQAKEYMMNNMENLLMSVSDGIMTDDDLRFFNKLSQRPQFKKMTDGIREIMSDPQSLGTQLVMKIASWMEEI